MPHTSYRLTAEGKGRPGFVKGSADVTLRADGATTIVDVAGTVQTGGPIARLGQRLIGGVSKMMLDRFFVLMEWKASALPTTRAIARDQRAPREHRNHRAPVLRAGVEVRVDVAEVLPGHLAARSIVAPTAAVPPAPARRSVRRRACDVGAGQPDAGRRDVAAAHVERRRDADDGVVRGALVQLGVGRGSHRRELDARR